MACCHRREFELRFEAVARVVEDAGLLVGVGIEQVEHGGVADLRGMSLRAKARASCETETSTRPSGRTLTSAVAEMAG